MTTANRNEAHQSQDHVYPRIWAEQNKAAEIAAAEPPPPPLKKYDDGIIPPIQHHPVLHGAPLPPPTPPPAGVPKALPPNMGPPQTKATPEYATAAAKKAPPALGNNVNGVPVKAPPPSERIEPPPRLGPVPEPTVKSPPKQLPEQLQ